MGSILCPASLRSPMKAGRYGMEDQHPSEGIAGGRLLPGASWDTLLAELWREGMLHCKEH